MKIVLAVHHFPPRYGGGAEWRVHRTAAVLQARGHSVRVICVERIDAGPPNGVAWTDEVYDGIPVRRLSFNLAAAPDPVRWEYDNLWVGEHLRAFLSEQRPDVFHLISGYLMSGRALQAAYEANLPALVTLTDFWFLCRRILMLRSDGQVSSLPIDPVTCARCLGEEKRRYRWPGRIAPALMDAFWRRQTSRIRQVEARQTFLRETLNRADAIISPSQSLRAAFVGAGINADRIVFLRQGRDFPGLSPETLDKKPASHLRIGYLGQIAEHKGVHVLFEAARQLPGARVRVSAYGDTTPFPNYTARLQRLIAGDARLTLAGPFPGQQVSQVFRELDVVVVPSLWYENSPNVILEAFAHGTPVVASNLGGMSELIEHGKNGLLFAPGDSGELARQLRRLTTEPGLLPSLRAGIGPVKTLAQEMDELEALYRQVVARKRDLRPEAAAA